MKFNVRILNWIIIGYCSIIMLLSVIALNGFIVFNKSKVYGFRSDYLFHVFLFIPWMVLARWRWKISYGKRIFWLSVCAGILFAGISEAIQIIIPDRSFNLIDIAANCAGLFVGTMISDLGWTSKRV